MDSLLMPKQDYFIALIVASAGMYLSSVSLSRMAVPLWLRVALGLALVSAVPLLIVWAPESVGWAWLSAVTYCLGFGINQVAAPWRVRMGRAA